MTISDPYTPPEASLNSAENAVEYDDSSPLSPTGRFGRVAFITYSAGLTFIIGVIDLVVARTGVNNFSQVALVYTLISIVAFIFSFIFIIRRLHDLDRTGFLSLLMLVPIVNIFLYIPLLFFRGTDGNNRYGPPRRYISEHSVILLSMLVITVAWVIFFGDYTFSAKVMTTP